ncbi:conserved hypothetical protein [Leishmania braziliensis MHOM/BR/75/M2904]|uniref:Uncharacterized protein n=2 Tax=Leishmania braziliensis TaxID=5660 RepID=A4H789_LEIBR|nr:conserved hypothetical protein [Leishmania braziliensis MHOM/BR/75/M2904]KAI5688693.1 hypothetical protein MNV84_01759 [Leishmania braziliensis]CAJ2468731.1 unnamed protein product [Leishmania braziliensis]CAJ2469264.1 unnamed protein product [Leishmania braziliensis]CAM45645.1 conserved hypothetical protein [Leishmania braziliensis MHOM/BR/75/M2904]SYZ63905.1 hypothetical_protein [Leishmania braziliensis MHOM/BR/75/M2904]
MRYRQPNCHLSSKDQQAKLLIDCNDILSTQEQEEVIAYFARSLRGNTQCLKVIVCLQAVLALVYTVLLLSGSLLIDVSVDVATTSSLVQLAQQQQRGSLEPVTAALTSTAPLQAPPAVLAALDAEQRAAQRKYVYDYMNRHRAAGIRVQSGGAITVLSAMVMLYSIALLLWAAWSCYVVCRRLRVNIESLTRTEPRDLHRRRPEGSPSHAAAPAKPRLTLCRLRQRVKADPAVALYVAAALSSLGSLFWITILVLRQRATQSAYADLGLQVPSVLSLQKITNAALEYVVAVWQPLFHLGIGLLVRSMLDTRESLVALSALKYRFEKA